MQEALGLLGCLAALTAGGFLRKQKIGRGNYYVNLALNEVLLR